MALSAQEYYEALVALLPQGRAWTLSDGGTLSSLLLAIADELARIDGRADDLLRESDPRNAIETLNAWERVLGLPDNCGDPPTTIGGRQKAAATKYGALGGQTPSYFVFLAKLFGFDITVSEFEPSRCGVLRTGDALADFAFKYYWQVTAPLETEVFFRTGASSAGEPLNDFGNEALECLMNRYKPAHTEVLFSYV